MTLQAAPKPEEGFQVKETPELIKFDKPGLQLAGKLVGCSLIEVEKKPVVQYLISIDGKKIFKFLGTYDLVQKLGKQDVGSQVRIMYLGEDEKVSRNGNSMKVFHVQTKRLPEATGPREHSPITDEDIPF